MKAFTKILIIGGFVGVVGLSGLHWYAGHWLKAEIEKRLDIQIAGELKPVWFDTAFEVRDVRVAWQGKAQVHSGDLHIKYDLPSLVVRNAIDIMVGGKNLSVTLLGDWARFQDLKDVEINSLNASLSIGREGIDQIRRLVIDSPTLQLQFGEASEKPAADLSLSTEVPQ